MDEKEPEFYEELKIRFTVIPEKKYPIDATPAEVTKYSMDHSFAFESMLQSLEHLNGKKMLSCLRCNFLSKYVLSTTWNIWWSFWIIYIVMNVSTGMFLLA